MGMLNLQELLKDKEIVDEINRYKWLQSEKQGYDIGFERAAREWINSYSFKFLNNRPGKATSILFKSIINTKIG